MKVEFPVPTSIHHLVIGKSGATIKDIRKQSGATVEVPASDKKSALVTVEGTEEQVEKARLAIEEATSYKIVADEPLETRQVKLAGKYHSRVIGPKGATLKSIKKDSGVVVNIPKKDEGKDYIELEGAPSLIPKAIELIEKATEQKLEGASTTTGSVSGSSTSTVVDKPLTIDSKVREVLFFPNDENVQRFIQYLRSAKKGIKVCVFTITDDRITNALIFAHENGVKVRVITDDEKAGDKGADITTLAKAGIEVRKDDSPFHMHHKFGIVDSKVLINGSFNWTRSASAHNQENMVITGDKPLVSAFNEEWDRLWKQFRNNKHKA